MCHFLSNYKYLYKQKFKNEQKFILRNLIIIILMHSFFCCCLFFCFCFLLIFFQVKKTIQFNDNTQNYTQRFFSVFLLCGFLHLIYNSLPLVIERSPLLFTVFLATIHILEALKCIILKTFSWLPSRKGPTSSPGLMSVQRRDNLQIYQQMQICRYKWRYKYRH